MNPDLNIVYTNRSFGTKTIDDLLTENPSPLFVEGSIVATMRHRDDQIVLLFGNAVAGVRIAITLPELDPGAIGRAAMVETMESLSLLIDAAVSGHAVTGH